MCKIRQVLSLVLGCAALLAIAPSARAVPIVTTVPYIAFIPGSVVGLDFTLDQIESDDTLNLYLERSKVAVGAAFSVDLVTAGVLDGTTFNLPLLPGMLGAGDYASWILHGDLETLSVNTITGSMTFISQIRGIILSNTLLAATDTTLGVSPLATYAGATAFRGFELGLTEDSFTLVDPYTLSFSLRVHSLLDEVRIVTDPVPEPHAAAIFGASALMVLGTLRRLRPARAS